MNRLEESFWFGSHDYIENNYAGFANYKHIAILKRGIILDTAPLFILIVGHYDKENNTKFIEKFKAHKGDVGPTYKLFDYNYLLAFLNSLQLGKCKLFITPHIFTEFVQHLRDCVKDGKEFRKILKEYFGTKGYIEENFVDCLDCITYDKFLYKEIEIGDVSITVLSKNNPNNTKAILTDDKRFAEVAIKEYGCPIIFYNEIRNATVKLKEENIPKEYLVEPI